MLRMASLYVVVCLGTIGVIVFGYYALIDWDALQKAYTKFVDVAQGQPELSTLFAAEAQQNIHRINLFADGVWTLQSAILSAIGIHGICTAPQRARLSSSR